MGGGRGSGFQFCNSIDDLDASHGYCGACDGRWPVRGVMMSFLAMLDVLMRPNGLARLSPGSIHPGANAVEQ